jgi:hypothetical protein
MSFDPNVYATLQATNPAAAQAYLTSVTQGAAAATAAPQATFQAPAFAAAQAQPQIPFNQLPQAQAQPPAQAAPVIRGSLADAYSQGSNSGTYGKSAKFPVVGHQFLGTVARDMSDTDVTVETDYATKLPKQFPDGTYRQQMKIPFDTQPTADFPEGKATVWAKTYLLQAVVAAMIAAGIDINAGEALRKGDQVWIQRTADIPSNKGNAAHGFTAAVQRAGNPTISATQTAPAPAAAPTVSAAPVVAQTAPAQQVFETPAFATTAALPAAPASPTPTASVPGLTPYQQALVKQATGQALDAAEAAILAAGPPQ